MPRMGKLGANLMGTTGDQLAFHQGKPLGRCQSNIIGLTGFRSRLGSIGDEYPILLGILKQIPLLSALGRLGSTLHDG